MIFLLLAVKVVQAIELGGFDVDMGTGSFEDDSSWDQEETTGGTTSSDNDNYDSNNNWSNTEDSWNTGDDSSGAGAGSYDRKHQYRTARNRLERFFSSRLV